jgi:hypothetical protein
MEENTNIDVVKEIEENHLHHHPSINTTSPIVSKVAIGETQRQPTRIVIIQSLDVDISTTRVEMVVAPIMDVVKRGVLIGSIEKLGVRLGGISMGKKLNGRIEFPTATTRVVGTP